MRYACLLAVSLLGASCATTHPPPAASSPAPVAAFPPAPSASAPAPSTSAPAPSTSAPASSTPPPGAERDLQGAGDSTGLADCAADASTRSYPCLEAAFGSDVKRPVVRCPKASIEPSSVESRVGGGRVTLGELHLQCPLASVPADVLFTVTTEAAGRDARLHLPYVLELRDASGTLVTQQRGAIDTELCSTCLGGRNNQPEQAQLPLPAMPGGALERSVLVLRLEQR